MSELFQTAFDLMDTRREGRIALSNVYEFVDAIDKPPSHQTVKRIYDEFDQDGSGDIDREEFLGLCGAMERLTQQSIDSMALQYTKKQYQALFDLVDDGEDADVRTISKSELKIFLDQSSHIFANLTSNDVVQIFKQYPQGELSFDDFCAVIGRVIKGKPISQVVTAFEDAKKKRLAAREKAYENFGQSAPKKGGKGGIASTAQQEQQATRDNRMFGEAFALMDSRGGGSVSLDQVYEFCECLPDPPSQGAIRKVYNQFDEDGSGDIDQDEFFGFCLGLEKVTNLPVKDMLEIFTRAMYKRLFELVDEGGDGNALVSKDELKVLLESIGPMLSSRLSASDVVALVRDFPGELTFDDFVSVVKKLTVGKSISQVVTAFEEAKRRRKAALHYALQRFDNGDGKGKAAAAGIDPDRAFCFTCTEKDEKIAELTAAFEQLKAATGDSAATAALQAAKAANADDIPPIGDLRESLHVVAAMQRQSFQRKYPEVIRPALNVVRSQRILSIMEFFIGRTKGAAVDTDGAARLINQNAPKHHELLDQLRAVVDVVMSEARSFFTMCEVLIAKIGSPASFKCQEVTEALDVIEIVREKVRSMKGDGNWLLEQLTELRNETCNAAVCVAPYSNRSVVVIQSAMDAEKLTQRMVDAVTALFFLGSEHPTDVEFAATKLLAGRKTDVTSVEVTDMEVNLRSVKELSSIDVFNRLFIDLQESMNTIRKNMSTASANKKDKAVMTQPMVDAMPQLKKQRSSAMPPDDNDPFASDDMGGSNVRMRSASPRMRQLKLKPRDPLAQVDKILESYRRDPTLLVPPNFQRAEVGTNSFAFGTRRIELVPVDRFVAVKVGGGYLMFDEFCKKYCEVENRRASALLERSQKQQQAAAFMVSAATPGMMTPRTPALASVANTPRTLVRTSHGVKLV